MHKAAEVRDLPRERLPVALAPSMKGLWYRLSDGKLVMVVQNAKDGLGVVCADGEVVKNGGRSELPAGARPVNVSITVVEEML